MDKQDLRKDVLSKKTFFYTNTRKFRTAWNGHGKERLSLSDFVLKKNENLDPFP
jgi:hypothetical protein